MALYSGVRPRFEDNLHFMDYPYVDTVARIYFKFIPINSVTEDAPVHYVCNNVLRNDAWIASTREGDAWGAVLFTNPHFIQQARITARNDLILDMETRRDKIKRILSTDKNLPIELLLDSIYIGSAMPNEYLLDLQGTKTDIHGWNLTYRLHGEGDNFEFDTTLLDKYPGDQIWLHDHNQELKQVVMRIINQEFRVVDQLVCNPQ